MAPTTRHGSNGRKRSISSLGPVEHRTNKVIVREDVNKLTLLETEVEELQNKTNQLEEKSPDKKFQMSQLVETIAKSGLCSEKDLTDICRQLEEVVAKQLKESLEPWKTGMGKQRIQTERSADSSLSWVCNELDGIETQMTLASVDLLTKRSEMTRKRLQRQLADAMERNGHLRVKINEKNTELADAIVTNSSEPSGSGSTLAQDMRALEEEIFGSSDEESDIDGCSAVKKGTPRWCEADLDHPTVTFGSNQPGSPRILKSW
ncbi:hypothetical protein K435DRAFT_804300 [Dendrothele bispora CBS 962.96]|uniref:Uncharacterized protein n=1 Tax=Dendrothele bispora (strain CBS 962.96) TaxID=1314807 RepID=A0A4S8LEW5_DENBC|nr:hypothetical protein K435DRAFT_804300 [Dendrothele bispora CBS 962.96]